MLSKKVEKALNLQIEVESNSSYTYLAMASWCEASGLEGSAKFFYKQSDEERMHMLRLFKYINESGGRAIAPVNTAPRQDFKDIIEVVQHFHNSELHVSAEVNKLVSITSKENDFTTLNFLQWYVREQHEEETLARTLLDKIKLIGTNANGLYWIDKEIESFINRRAETANNMGEADAGA